MAKKYIISKCRLLLFICLQITFFAQTGCHDNKNNKTNINIKTDKKPDAGQIAATVDGEAITIDDIKFLIKTSPEHLTKEQALNKLIKEQLLVKEAKRLGYGHSSAVKIEKMTALALKFLKLKGKSYTYRDIDDKFLKEAYEKEKRSKFVHGRQLIVTHALVPVGNNGYDDAEAQKIVTELKEKTQNAKDLSTFKKIAENFQKKYDKIKIEKLPPFEQNDARFVKEFTEAAFIVQKPLKISGIVKTLYGYHLIFIAKTINAINISFKEAKPLLAKELIEPMRKKYIKRLIKSIYDNADIFIYDNAIANSN
jgi:hypothetical protein